MAQPHDLEDSDEDISLPLKKYTNKILLVKKYSGLSIAELRERYEFIKIQHAKTLYPIRNFGASRLILELCSEKLIDKFRYMEHVLDPRTRWTDLIVYPMKQFYNVPVEGLGVKGGPPDLTPLGPLFQGKYYYTPDCYMVKVPLFDGDLMRYSISDIWMVFNAMYHMSEEYATLIIEELKNKKIMDEKYNYTKKEGIYNEKPTKWCWFPTYTIKEEEEEEEGENLYKAIYNNGISLDNELRSVGCVLNVLDESKKLFVPLDIYVNTYTTVQTNKAVKNAVEDKTFELLINTKLNIADKNIDGEVINYIDKVR